MKLKEKNNCMHFAFRNILINIIIILTTLGSVRADEVHLQFDRANQLYRDGKYQEAANFYLQIANNGFVAAGLYYNIANTYLKLDSLPSAILYYERAKKLSPADEDIRYNLKLANLKIVDRIEPLPELFYKEWWNSWGSTFSSNEWGYIAMALIWLSMIMGIIFRLSQNIRFRKILFIVILLFVLSCISTLNFAYKQFLFEGEKNEAIIFSSIVYVKNSPNESGTDIFILHQGLKLEVLDSVGEWKKIRIADGNIGWVQQNAIEII